MELRSAPMYWMARSSEALGEDAPSSIAKCSSTPGMIRSRGRLLADAGHGAFAMLSCVRRRLCGLRFGGDCLREMLRAGRLGCGNEAPWRFSGT